MLDTNKVEQLDDFEAVRRISAGVAVEANLGHNDTARTEMPRPQPESAILDRSVTNMMKPRPQPKPAPERRGRRRKP
jgi:hypothetical protein